MTAKTHCVGGILLSSVSALVFSPLVGTCNTGIIETVVFVGGGMLGAIFPDIDEPNSRISHKMPFLSMLFSFNRLIKKRNAEKLFLSADDRERARNELRDASHRGVTHYLITWALVLCLAIILLAAFIGNASHVGVIVAIFSLGVSVGWLSHILLDIISGRVPLFAPFYRKSIGVCIFKTGGVLERIVVRPLLTVGVLYVWIYMIKGWLR